MFIVDSLVSNAIIAALLALFAVIVGQITTKPQIKHALWLLVLVKLVTPPLVNIDLPFATLGTFQPATRTLSSVANTPLDTSSAPTPIAATTSETLADPLTNSRPAESPTARSSSFAVPWLKVAATIWLTGSIIWYGLVSIRLFEFRKILRFAKPATDELISEVRQIATKLGLSSIPRVSIASANLPPLIWSFGGQNAIVLPSDLLKTLDDEERRGMLAHELAHLKRRDHCVRWLELFALGIYWWNPVAWWAREQVQRAEEECCDRWVLWAYPDIAVAYAQTLVNTVDFLAASPTSKLVAASTLTQGESLRRRVEMILGPSAAKTISWKPKLALLVFALGITPLTLTGADENKPDDRRDESGEADVERIHGTVVDEQGKPISGATVWHPYAYYKLGYGRMEATATTDASGRFTVEIPTKLPDDVVAFPWSTGTWAYSPKHCLGWARCVSDQKKPDDNRIALTPSTETTFVVLDPDGNPVQNVIVEPVNYRNQAGYDLVPTGAKPALNRRTDAEGRVQMPAMARDRLFLVQVSSPEYGIQRQQLEVHPDAPAERTIQLRPVCRIEGRFIAKNLKWAQSVRLTVSTEPRGGNRPPWPTEGTANVISDASGNFVIPKIADGRITMFQIVVDEDLPVRPKLPKSRKLNADGTTIFHIPMVELVDIRGLIVADDTGQPLPNIDIHVYYGDDRQGTDVVSDENGEFTARVLPGRVRFQPQNLGTTKYVQLGSPVPFDVPEDAKDFEAPTIKPVMTEPLDGTLVDQDKAPVANAEVIAYYKNWLCSSADTDANGKFRLPKMPTSIDPGDATYRVVLGVGETRHMRTGDVAITEADPLTISVKR